MDGMNKSRPSRLSRIMCRSAFPLFLALILTPAASAFAQETVVLTNGDRLHGRLTSIEGDRWVFRHAVAGELAIPHGEVRSFEAPEPIAVRLRDGTIAVGRIEATGQGMRLVTGTAQPRPVIPADLAAVAPADDPGALRPPRPVGRFSPLDRFWSATAGLGFSSSSGNSRSRGFAGDLKIGRDTPRDRIALELGLATTLSAPPGGDTLEKVVEKYYGALRVDVFFASRFFVFGTMRQDRDRFQGIDLRSNYHGGLGLQALAGGGTDLRIYASGGMRREAFVTDSVFATPVLGAGGAFTQRLGPVELTWNLDWVPRAAVLSDYRAVSSAAITTTVFRGLGFRVTSRNELNNRPPAGVEKHDWLLTTALTYTVGR
jgi:putative salt-induced outer membrane protein YdiY